MILGRLRLLATDPANNHSGSAMRQPMDSCCVAAFLLKMPDNKFLNGSKQFLLREARTVIILLGADVTS